MTQKRQRNCHARSRRRRKILRLKNRLESIIARRVVSIRKANKAPGFTFRATEEVRAHNVAMYSERRGLYDHGHVMRLNQRQLRKRRRQSPWYKKTAA